MKQVIVLLVLIAAVHGLGSWKSGLRVRFDLNPLGFGKSSFISLPRTVSEAKHARWVETPRPHGPMPSLILFCPSTIDKLTCAMYDETGYIAGLQFALPTDEYTSTSGMDMNTLGYTLWTPPVTSGSVRSYWTAQQYYVDEEFLEKSVEERLAERNPKKTIQGDYVWVTSFGGNRMAIPTDGNAIADSAKTFFTKQSCFIMMGRHYFYNMTTLTPCDSEHILPWFALVHSGELIGVGFLTIGQLPSNNLPRDYFERNTRKNVELIIKNGPECIFDLVDREGIVTVHTYFVDHPWLIDCIGQ
ncbi:hypothetical protein ACJJTC_004785 [Scirpophaga incertulas]